MFSHISEETARLSHGFLGALFSTLLVFTHESAIGIVLLSAALFTIFLGTTTSMHFLFKAHFEGKSVYYIHTAVVIFLILALSIFTVLGFAVEGSGVFPFSSSSVVAIRVGLIVFATFLTTLIISHIAAIFRRDEV